MAPGICRTSGWKRGNLELSAQTSTGIRADRGALRGRGDLDRFRPDPPCIRARQRGPDRPLWWRNFAGSSTAAATRSRTRWKPSPPAKSATRMALAVSRGSADYSGFVNQAKSSGRQPATGFSGVRRQQRHDSVVGAVAREIRIQGQFPSPAFACRRRQDAFLRQEDLPDGVALSLSAIRQVAGR